MICIKWYRRPFLKVAHLTKTRHAHDHQVTVASLSCLLYNAYLAYTEDLPHGDEKLSFDAWEKQRLAESRQFQYWKLTIELQLTILTLVRSQRDGRFDLYLESLSKLVPQFFALDQISYARWLPIHIRDLSILPNRQPEVQKEFEDGIFVIHKPACVSPVKRTRGAVGLTESPNALQ